MPLSKAERLVMLGTPTQQAKEFANTIDDATGLTTALRGTFTMNGVTNVVVANANLAADDQIIYTLKTPGGTVGTYPVTKTRTNGTGFAVAGTASDTSIYDYRILKA